MASNPPFKTEFFQAFISLLQLDDPVKHNKNDNNNNDNMKIKKTIKTKKTQNEEKKKKNIYTDKEEN